MLFNSWSFFVLLCTTFSLFYICPIKKWQTAILISANVIFYSYHNPKLLGLLLFSALMDAGISYAVYRGYRPRLLTTVGIASELLLLIFFKYPKLIHETFFSGFGETSPFVMLLSIPLPIGISFYCFQGISLLIDSYRGEVPYRNLSLREHISRTFFFISFFPHLIAGPIVKAGEFMPQIGPKFFREIRWDIVLCNLTIGYFFKVVVADNLAIQTQNISTGAMQYQSGVNLLGLLFGYSIQIFADFAGYSLIAIGLAAMFGYKFPQNFNRPYISASFSEFWTRWHMSLSRFLRNYLYIPLGGNREGALRTYMNLLLVMFLGGLWHGGAWSYAVWGLWHGAWLVIERFFKNQTSIRLPRPLAIVFVFLTVTAGWLLFRLPEFSDVVTFVKLIGHNWHSPVELKSLVLIAIFSLPILLHHARELLWHSRSFYQILPTPIYWVGRVMWFAAMIFLILTASGDRAEFIYFQF